MASRVVIGATGKEVQLAGAAYPRWSFILTYGWLREQTQNIVPSSDMVGMREFEQITGLFLLCKGAYGEFYYSDPDDNSRSGNFVGWGDGAKTQFQIYYQWGNGPFGVPMTIPVGGIQSVDRVYFNGSPVGGYGTDATNTQLVFSTAPPVNAYITADFHFYFRCRFLDDHLNFSQFARNRWEMKEIRFESVKP